MLLLQALNFVGHVALRGGTILFLPNKKDTQRAIQASQRSGEYCDIDPNCPLFSGSTHQMLTSQSDTYRINPDVIILLNCLGQKPGVLPDHITKACERNVPIVAMCDTDINSSMISYPIPSNDDHAKAEDYVCTQIENVIIKAKNLRDTIPGYKSHWAKSGIEKQFSPYEPKPYDAEN